MTATSLDQEKEIQSAFETYVREAMEELARVPDLTKDNIVVSVSEVKRISPPEGVSEVKCPFLITVREPSGRQVYHLVAWEYEGGASNLIGTVWPPWLGVCLPGRPYGPSLLTYDEYKVHWKAEKLRTT